MTQRDQREIDFAMLDHDNTDAVAAAADYARRLIGGIWTADGTSLRGVLPPRVDMLKADLHVLIAETGMRKVVRLTTMNRSGECHITHASGGPSYHTSVQLVAHVLVTQRLLAWVRPGLENLRGYAEPSGDLLANFDGRGLLDAVSSMHSLATGVTAWSLRDATGDVMHSCSIPGHYHPIPPTP